MYITANIVCPNYSTVELNSTLQYSYTIIEIYTQIWGRLFHHTGRQWCCGWYHLLKEFDYVITSDIHIYIYRYSYKYIYRYVCMLESNLVITVPADVLTQWFPIDSRLSDDMSSTDFRFVPSQWETALLCNDVSHWLSANLESVLCVYNGRRDSANLASPPTRLPWTGMCPDSSFTCKVKFDSRLSDDMFIMADEILQILQQFKRDFLEQGCISMLRFQEGVN